jgi:hypothetical protein
MSLVAALESARTVASAREKATVTPPGQRWVPVHVEEFEEILAPLGFARNEDLGRRVGQVVFSKTSRLDSKVLMLVYTSIPLFGDTARGVGEDSIKVSIVRSADGFVYKPLVKKLPYACRTRGWRSVLLAKLEEQMRRFGQQPCRTCGAATLERVTKDERKFYGCVRFPDCKGSAPA